MLDDAWYTDYAEWAIGVAGDALEHLTVEDIVAVARLYDRYIDGEE